MKQLFTLMAAAIFCTAANAQNDTTITAKKESDTIRIGNMIIVKKGGGESKNKYTHIDVERRHQSKPANISTNWGIVDLGFNNFVDKTNYGNTGGYLFNRPGAAPLGKNDFDLNSGKSVNVNIWVFMQRFNLIKHHVNLKYGLGLELNNYRYNSNISYLKSNPFAPGQTPSPVIIRDSITFSKNKLAADYVTIPLMLNFCTNPGYINKGLSLSVGISAGYLYNQRNKQISQERGKLKTKGGLGVEDFKFSYIAELGLGPVHLYGSYAPKTIYKTGLDMRPYTFGLRLSNW
jgi:Outer membrane protein beta-barrel domain